MNPDLQAHLVRQWAGIIEFLNLECPEISLRFMHTSDWHLGRQFHGASLLDDQAHVLDQIVAYARDRAVDAVLVAGDLYDRSVPPAAATALLDRVLSELAIGSGIPVVLISGNHDGPVRMGFGARAMESAGIFLRTGFDPQPVVLSDVDGPVAVYCLPYAEPARVGSELGLEVASHDAAMAALLARFEPAVDGARSILVSHCFAAGGAVSDSERPLSVGGVEQVAANRFEGFDYVALGHLHRPQSLAGGRARYSGSILKYSFSESADAKSVELVEMDAAGKLSTESLPLFPRRDVRVVVGGFADIVAAAGDDPGRDDYLLIRLQDSHAIFDLMARLREAYPNVLHVERPALARSGDTGTPHRDRLKSGELPLVADFWEHAVGEPLDDDSRREIAAALDAVRREPGEET